MLAGRELPTACKRCFVFSCISKNAGKAELRVSILYCKDSISICSSRKAEYKLRLISRGDVNTNDGVLFLLPKAIRLPSSLSLLFYIVLNRSGRHISGSAYKIAACPHLHNRVGKKLLLEYPAGGSFNNFHDFCST